MYKGFLAFSSWSVRGTIVLVNPNQVCSIAEGFLPNAKASDEPVCRVIHTSDGNEIKVMESIESCIDKLRPSREDV